MITGSDDALYQFREMAKSVVILESGEERSTALSFEEFFPVPVELYDKTPCWHDDPGIQAQHDDETAPLIEKYAYPDWVSFCRGEWGTRRDATSVSLAVTADRLDYQFYTASAPPLKFVERVSHRFPGLLFELRYWDDQTGYHGIWSCRAGRVIEDVYDNAYDDDPDDDPSATSAREG